MNIKIDFLLKEYEKLKDEQIHRIGFRDQMIYVSLGVTGAVFSFGLENRSYNFTLLVLPFVSSILGWTYLTNDERISEIGRYIRSQLIPGLNVLSGGVVVIDEMWENRYLKSIRRKERKAIQLFFDIGLFCFAPIMALVTYFLFNDHLSKVLIGLLFLEGILSLGIAYQFISYSELYKKGSG